LIRIHFWTTAVGIALYFLSLTWGGWYQGIKLSDSDVPFMDIVNYTLPYLQARSWSGALMTVGHLAFAWLFIANLCRRGQKRYNPMLLGDEDHYRSLTNPATAQDSPSEKPVDQDERP
jgi:cytochrome c oxidase cbb3-type subunit 1